MTLEDLGYNLGFENFRKQKGLDVFDVGRVISEHKERYVVRDDKQEYDAEIVGSLRFSAQDRSEFPAVGDWVAISTYDGDKAIIHAIFPRNSKIERQAVGATGEKQIIATNIDIALIVQSVDRDFNINRIERYLTLCYSSNVEPTIVLNKIDLIEESDLADLKEKIKARIPQVPVFALSNRTLEGVNDLRKLLITGQTICLLGSSGVGKSSLTNTLMGKSVMETNEISNSTGKGKHVTSHRELVLLENGGVIIDNPGMREVGLADASAGLELTFEPIIELSKACKFNDCSHISEIGCAVISALEKGEIDKSTLENYLKMQRENDHFESTVAEKRKKDKDFGKMVKHFKQIKASKKY